MLAMLPSQLAFADPITTHIPLIQLLLASLGILSVALYLLERHKIEKANQGRGASERNIWPRVLGNPHTTHNVGLR